MKKDIITSIISKVGSDDTLPFKVIDGKALQEINEWLPEVTRATNAFNKRNSQTTTNLMSLNMVDAGPYRILRQILAQVAKKKVALADAWYQLEIKKLKHSELEKQLKFNLITPLETIEMRKIEMDIENTKGPIEAALKEIGALKRSYEQIRKNNNIPDNWDEVDFEKAEIEHHIKSIFRNAVRDRMQGTHNQGTMEYMEQFGINPITAYAIVDDYINKTKKMIAEKEIGPDIVSHYKFYEEMYIKFKDAWKKAAAKIGLDSITHTDFLFKDAK